MRLKWYVFAFPSATGNLNIFQRCADLAGRILDAVNCQICESLPVQPYRSVRAVNRRGLVLTAPNSIHCRHLYCAPCLAEWWGKNEKRVCITCKQESPHPPVRDLGHGLLTWAHEDAGKGTRVDTGGDDPHFSQFFALVNPVSSIPHDGSYNEGDGERMLVETVESVPGRGDKEIEGAQVTLYGDNATPNV